MLPAVRKRNKWLMVRLKYQYSSENDDFFDIKESITEVSDSSIVTSEIEMTCLTILSATQLQTTEIWRFH